MYILQQLLKENRNNKEKKFSSRKKTFSIKDDLDYYKKESTNIGEWECMEK
jgi:hypothetical protein